LASYGAEEKIFTICPTGSVADPSSSFHLEELIPLQSVRKVHQSTQNQLRAMGCPNIPSVIGNVWFWGTGENKPSLVQPNTSFHSVAVGANKSYGLTRDGKVLSWDNEDPTKLEQLNSKQNSWFGTDKVLQISAFGENVACVTGSGKAMAMGRGGLGQLGNGKVDETARN
jgi:hypothetical protein